MWSLINCSLLLLGLLGLELASKFSTAANNNGLEDNKIPLSPSSPSSESKKGTSCECSANITRQIFTRLPTLIEAIGRDERTKWSFRGPKGDRGFEGAAGPQGLQGTPGRQGERGYTGVDGLPGPRGLPGHQGEFGEKGSVGIKGQKGEPAPSLYSRRTYDGTVVEIKGEKGEMGTPGFPGIRGIKGEAGIPGLSIKIKGDKGDPCLLPNLDELRGPPGPRGPPGVPGLCRRCRLKKKLISEVDGPIYIPVDGPPGRPGLSVVGEPGPPGPPGLPAVTQIHAQQSSKQEVVQYPTERHLVAYDRSSPGTLIFTTEEEKLFIRTRRGWNEIEFGRFISPVARLQQPPYSNYLSSPARGQRDQYRNPRYGGSS